MSRLYVSKYVSFSLNSVKGDYIREYIGTTIGIIKGDTRMLDYSSCILKDPLPRARKPRRKKKRKPRVPRFRRGVWYKSGSAFSLWV